MALGGPFATHLIVGPTCFFLGMLFANLPYDYYVLWAVPEAGSSSVFGGPEEYITLFENHMRFLHASPPLINRILHLVMALGIIGLLAKLYKPSEANMLFDGASLVLYMIGVIVYGVNIIKGLRIVSDGVYNENESANAAAGPDSEYLGREDTLKVLAASNTILALVLIGVLVLQSGQWYAQKKEAAEMAEMDRAAGEKQTRNSAGTKAGTKAGGGDKKKQ